MANQQEYDAIVVGGGIAGMESSINLGDMGFKTLLVEKQSSIGGKMILLSKVFPTLDCASCISGPKMAGTAHHPNIDMMTSTEIKNISKNSDGTFTATILKKPTYVDNNACTGCQQCEEACTVTRPDEYQYDLVSRKTIFIPFPQAIPKKAFMERAGTSPCINRCPADVKANGYISLTRMGKYKEAFNLHLEDAPIPGSLGRACYAPCEGECTRGDMEGTVDIRKIKRFFSDQYYAKHPEPEYGAVEQTMNKSVAVIGGGPAGLTAAFFLAKKGYKVKIFEAKKELGGMLKYGIPSFRLPNNIVDRDIKNITALGVEVETNNKVENVLDLKNKGFNAVFVSVGTHETRKFNFEGSDLQGTWDCLDFLQRANSGEKINFAGKNVAIFGGGNVGIDTARVAIRLKAKKVTVIYRRSRQEMPAFDFEIKEAEEEGVEFQFLTNPVKFIGENGNIKQAVCVKMKLGKPDESGRRRPVVIKGSEHKISVDAAIMSIGLMPSTSPYKGELELNSDGTIKVNNETLQSSKGFVFAGGDVATGASTIIEAVGQGKRASFFIDRYLQGQSLENTDYGYHLAVVDKESILKNRKSLNEVKKPRVNQQERSPVERIHDFDEIESTFTEEEAFYSASRCMDCGTCSECHQCVEVCPAHCIDFNQKPEELTIHAKSVVMATGFNLFDAQKMPRYGFGVYKNVVNSMQMERIIAPTKPYHTVLRPTDGKVPDNIAYVLCVGSRDHTIGNPICSQICCMYSIKHAQLLMGSLPLADITIYYINIRAFGKGFEEFYQQAKGMGVQFVKGKVAKIKEKENGNLILRYEDIANGTVREAEHDMVVLSVGVLPNQDVKSMFSGDKVKLDKYNFIDQVDQLVSPESTSIEGVYVAGTASGPKDIPDSIVSAGGAASEAAGYIRRLSK